MVMHVLRCLALLAAVGQTAAQKPASVIPAIDEGPAKAHSYDWMARHNAIVDRVKKGNVDLVFIGDSITHAWEGNGKQSWDRYYGKRNAVNMGFGWDRTEHVLWRLQHGEIAGISPKVAVILIGVNNLGSNHSVDDTVTGIEAVIDNVRHDLPRTKILLLGIFPCQETLTSPQRIRVNAVNERLAKMDGRNKVTYLDFGQRFLRSDGTMSRLVMPDFLHPNAHGYRMWAEEMEPTLSRLMDDRPIDPSDK